ncbi:MAG: tetratricopeptide repeat protein [Chthoniobacteraceae bacterium]
MVFRPEVFISATPKELDPYRDVVKAALRELGAHAVEHTDLNASYGPLDGILKVAIGHCDAVLHLTAFAFGPEPTHRTHGATRRSFGHFEYDVARALHKEVLSFVARPGTSVAQHAREDDEARTLQHEHRRAIERGGEHWTFGGLDELGELIRSLRPRIMVRRRLARLPFAARGKQLFGRDRALAEVRDALAAGPVVVLEPPPQFATSSASAGKSALAVEAAWRLYESGRYDFVFHVPAVSGAELESELVALTHGDSLALVKDEIAGHRVRLNALRAWLRADEHAGRVLIILDGVDTEATWIALESMLPWFERAALIITTRQPREVPGATRIGVGSLAVEAAVSLLATRIHGREPMPAELRPLEALAAALGQQPFALQLAARAIADSRETPDAFLAALGAEVGAAARGGASQTAGWLPVVESVVRRSIARLDSTARGLLYVLVCLAPQPTGIPQSLIAGANDAGAARVALGQLEKLGLVTFADEGQLVLVHRLVREIVRDRLTPEQTANAMDSARALMESALSRTGQTASAAVVRTRLVTHCRVLLGQLNGHPLEVRAASLARGVAEWLRDCGRTGAAEHFQRRALAIAERACEPGHPDLVPELRLLAAILHDRRRFAEAAELHRRAIAILEVQPATRPGELVTELFALASCQRVAGQLAEAVPVLRRALETEERTSGRMHARTAIAAHVFASLLEVLHRPREAVPLYRRALEIDEQLPHCPPARVGARLHHLAVAVAACGEHHEAIALHQRAIPLDEQAFGKAHPELVAPLKQLAAIFEVESRHAEAAALLRRALAIEEKSAGVPPLELASTLTSLATALAAGAARAEAGTLARRAIELIDRGPKWHPLCRVLRGECEGLIEGRLGTNSAA